MRIRRRTLIALALAIVGLAMLVNWYFYLRSRFISPAEFDLVSVGMTWPEVVAILGPPTGIGHIENVPERRIGIWNSGGWHLIVSFDNGTVVEHSIGETADSIWAQIRRLSMRLGF